MAIDTLTSSENTFVSGGCDASARLWDIREGACVQSFHDHESDINTIAYHPSGLAFGTGSDDRTCRIFDLRSSSQIVSFESDEEMDNGNISSISFSKSGRLLYAAGEHNVEVRDTLKQETVGYFGASEHEAKISCVAIPPDGIGICTASWCD